MAVELDQELNEPSEAETRINQLSKRVSVTTEERDAAKAAQAAAETAAAEVTRERDFYAGFADIMSTQPAAKDHKDEILAKVKSGYSIADATTSVLFSAGKLSTPQAPLQPIAGGSSPTNPPQGGTPSVQDMTQEQRRAALLEAQNRGDLALT